MSGYQSGEHNVAVNMPPSNPNERNNNQFSQPLIQQSYQPQQSPPQEYSSQQYPPQQYPPQQNNQPNYQPYHPPQHSQQGYPQPYQPPTNNIIVVSQQQQQQQQSQPTANPTVVVVHQEGTDGYPRLQSSLAVIVLIINIFFPGIGTILMGCAGNVNSGGWICVGICQLILTLFIVGWIWGIVTGLMCIKYSK